MRFPKDKVVIGITGGIGCGKSTLLNIFKNKLQYEYFCLCADDICHRIYAKKGNELNKYFSEHWGENFLNQNGLIDRKRVATKIFNARNYKKELIWLNDILHPYIFAEAQNIIKNTNLKFIIFDIPLLFECKLEKNFNDTICIWSDNKLQNERLIDRGYSKEEIIFRKSVQLPAREKLERANYGIINNGSLNELVKQCKLIDKKLRVKYDRKKTK